MTFISYAQNNEDVLLYRAFKDLPTGFYVDIGANDPVKDSVTQAFYERSWHGINIDPVPQWHGRLQQHRKRDINLAIAVSDQAGEFEFFELPETGLSTLNAYQASAYRQEGQFVRQVKVSTKTLAEVIDEHAPPEIHFLKIDVEGAEAAVIRGADWKRHRPWVVLVESTLPNTNTSVHESWEPMLLANHYHFVWFDGINRFYVADEHSELDSAFQVPVNVLDHHISIDTFNLKVGARELKLELTESNALKMRLLERELEVRGLNDGIASARLAYEHAQAVANRLPCRLVRGFLKLPFVLIRKFKALMRMLLSKVLKSVYVFLKAHSKTLARSIKLVEKMPFLSARLRSLLGMSEKTPRPVDETRDQSPSLSPDQLKIYQQIIGS